MYGELFLIRGLNKVIMYNKDLVVRVKFLEEVCIFIDVCIFIKVGSFGFFL